MCLQTGREAAPGPLCIPPPVAVGSGGQLPGVRAVQGVLEQLSVQHNPREDGNFCFVLAGSVADDQMGPLTLCMWLTQQRKCVSILSLELAETPHVTGAGMEHGALSAPPGGGRWHPVTQPSSVP